MSTTKTSIEWCDRTWNCVRGCSRISEGCRNCYAERMAARFSLLGVNGPGPFHGFAQYVKGQPRWTGKVELVPSALAAPLSWRKPARVFVNSMSDLFHEALSFEDIAQVFNAMLGARQHTFQVLTKRPARMLEFLSACRPDGFGWVTHDGTHPRGAYKGTGVVVGFPDAWPLPNVWLGVSVEDQKTADERIPLLLQAPAAVRFVSYEPALGPVDFQRWVTGSQNFHMCADVAGMLRNRSFHCLDDDSGRPMTPAAAKAELQGLLARGVKLIPGRGCDDFDPEKGCRGHRNARLDWVIVGGESGPHARPFDPQWMRSAVAQCRAANVAVFCKQWGSRPIVEPDAPNAPRVGELRLRNSKGGDISEWGPGDWPREFPAVRS